MDETIRALCRRYTHTPDDATAHSLARAVTRAAGTAFGVVTIPSLGSRLTLADPWTFSLYGEKRNTGFWDKLHGRPARTTAVTIWSGYEDPASPGRYPPAFAKIETTLKPGTVLRVDRVYIRAGQDDFDSITFVCESMPDAVPDSKKPFTKGKNKIVGRFWAKLHDVNRIVCEWDEVSVPREEVKQ